MLLYYITDRRSMKGEVLNVIADALAVGVDYIQIREKDLPPRELFDLAVRVKALENPHGTRILINERLDVALAAGLDGVHLQASYAPIEAMRQAAGRAITVGVSCHSLAEVAAADEAGADLIVFAPVFTPISKASQSTAQGIDALKQAAAASTAPVLALGGLTPERIPACIEAGAAGVAGISLFQTCADLGSLVRAARLDNGS